MTMCPTALLKLLTFATLSAKTLSIDRNALFGSPAAMLAEDEGTFFSRTVEPKKQTSGHARGITGWTPCNNMLKKKYGANLKDCHSYSINALQQKYRDIAPHKDPERMSKYAYRNDTARSWLQQSELENVFKSQDACVKEYQYVEGALKADLCVAIQGFLAHAVTLQTQKELMGGNMPLLPTSSETAAERMEILQVCKDEAIMEASKPTPPVGFFFQF